MGARRVSCGYWDIPAGPMVKTPHASNAGGMDLIPGQGTKSPHAVWHSQKKKEYLLHAVAGVTESELAWSKH